MKNGSTYENDGRAPLRPPGFPDVVPLAIAVPAYVLCPECLARIAAAKNLLNMRGQEPMQISPPRARRAKARNRGRRVATVKKPKVGERTIALIFAGLENEQIMEVLAKEYPERANSLSNVRWYRSYIKRENIRPPRRRA